jgi:translation elongation factor EF-Tu-like GTPase
MSRTIFHADIRLLDTAHGGRRTPLCSGYRSLIRFGESDSDLGAEITFDPEALPEGIAPGNVGRVTISTWADAPANLASGQVFELREGHGVVGSGTVVDADRD